MFPYLMMFMFLLSACTTTYTLPNGQVIVPRTAEVRSPFGTNMGFVMLERCETMEKVNAWTGFKEKEPVKCEPITPWHAAYSQGQGGQIVSGALIGLGFGLGSAFGPSSSASSSSSSAASATAPAAKHGY